jgi:thiamine pyrophosphate-dependent acetolactate synthase large subunit-like protein
VVASRSTPGRSSSPSTTTTPRAGLKPQMVVEQLRDAAPDDAIVVSGVGQHQMWASQYWQFDHPYTWVNSGWCRDDGLRRAGVDRGQGGAPGRTVWAIDGDGCFQMTAQELVTATAEQIPVKIAILNNAYLGMVRQWQEMFYEERYSEVYLSPDLPDYVKWAEAMGCVGIRAESPEDVGPAIEKANSIDDRPVVVDFRTDAFEKVYPMVAAGQSNDDIVVDPIQGPRADDPGRQPVPGGKGGKPATTSSRCWSRTRPASCPAWPACSAAAASTSTPWRSPRPTRTSTSAASPSWSTSSRRPSSR